MALYSDPDLSTMVGLYIANATCYMFADCDNITGWSVFAFGSSIGAQFGEKDGGTPDNLTFYRLGLDTPSCKSSLRINGAGTVNIYGLSSASNKGPGIYEAGTITGGVYVYGQNMWGGCVNKLKKPSGVIIYKAE